jgi:hypothetical protein
VSNENIDEEKRNIYNHTARKRENERKEKKEKKSNGFPAMHF